MTQIVDQNSEKQSQYSYFISEWHYQSRGLIGPLVIFVTIGKEIEIEIPTKVDFCPSFDWVSISDAQFKIPN